jgi:hypothetical protein
MEQEKIIINIIKNYRSWGESANKTDKELKYGSEMLSNWWDSFRYKKFVSIQPTGQPQGEIYTLLYDGNDIASESVQITTTTSKIDSLTWNKQFTSYLDKMLFDISTNKGMKNINEISELLFGSEMWALVGKNCRWKSWFDNYSNVVISEEDYFDSDEIIINKSTDPYRMALVWAPYVIAPREGFIKDDWLVCPHHKKNLELYRIYE